MNVRWNTALGAPLFVLLLLLAATSISTSAVAAPFTVPERGIASAEPQKVQFFWPFSSSPPDARRGRAWNQPSINRRVPRPGSPELQPAARSAPAVPRGPVASVFGETPAIENATRVVVFGDSMAVGLADALTSVLTEENGYQVQRMTRSSSGIVRKDYFDWAGEVREAIKDERIDVAVWMIGINDRQAIRADGDSFEPKTPRWTEIYQSRVDELVKMLQEHGAAVYWVGLPIMRAQRYSQDIAYINNTIRERAGLLGAEFIDVWDAFADADGAYSTDGPDLSGTRKRMRRDNGIHLTDAGNEKLAHFIDQAVQRDISVAGLGVDGRRVIRQSRSGGLLIAPGTGSGEGTADELAGAVPAAPGETGGLGGPSIALSTVGSGTKSDGEAVVSPLFQVLMRGEALEPKPGRADDFSWPRDQ